MAGYNLPGSALAGVGGDFARRTTQQPVVGSRPSPMTAANIPGGFSDQYRKEQQRREAEERARQLEIERQQQVHQADTENTITRERRNEQAMWDAVHRPQVQPGAFIPPSGGIYPNAGALDEREKARFDAENRRKEMELEARLLAEREQRERDFTQQQTQQGRNWQVEDRNQIPGMWNMLTGEGGAGSGPAAGAGLSNQTADLAFARAKDREGLMASQALRDLSQQMTMTGRAGGGHERLAQAATMGGAFSNLNDVNINQALAEADRAWAVDDRNYNAAVTRRGQNMGIAPTILGLYQGGPRY